MSNSNASETTSTLAVAIRKMRTVLFGRDPEPGSGVLIAIGLALVAVTIGLFLIQPIFVSYGLFAFLAVVLVGWFTYQAATARLLTLIATVSTVLTIGFITFFLFWSARPALIENGSSLITVPKGMWFFFLDAVLPTAESYYNPAAGAVSLIPFFWGTVVVTLIAGLIAAPLGVLGALFISEVAGGRTRSIIKPGVEILAGIPSIVYGFIGFTILNNFVKDTFIDQGASFLIAGLVVGIMALPTVVSVSEDALSSVPSSMSDGSAAMGATEWQTMKSISVPAAFSGISAAIILGIGRAIGETMAVAAILAGGALYADPLFDIFHANMTLTSLIAIQYGNASQSLEHVLFVAGTILFVIIAVTSIVSQYIERRVDKKLKGQG